MSCSDGSTLIWALDGLADGRSDFERQVDPQHEVRHVGHEVPHELEHVLLVVGPMRLEPFLFVVAADIPQERERLAGEALKLPLGFRRHRVLRISVTVLFDLFLDVDQDLRCL